MSQNKDLTTSDKVGITSAVLCTIHCLAIPALFIFKTWYANGVSAYELPSWWASLDILFLVVSFVAVYHSASHTGPKKIKVALWFFWLLLSVSIIYEAQLHWLAYIASAGLVTTHFINIRRLKRRMNASIAS